MLLISFFFFFNDTATTEIYTLSLHDALPISIQETLREVQRCTKEGITINTFMLERSRALAEFVAHMTRMNRGRAFYATPEHLGEYVLVDFVSRRTKKVS